MSMTQALLTSQTFFKGWAIFVAIRLRYLERDPVVMRFSLNFSLNFIRLVYSAVYRLHKTLS